MSVGSDRPSPPAREREEFGEPTKSAKQQGHTSGTKPSRSARAVVDFVLDVLTAHQTGQVHDRMQSSGTWKKSCAPRAVAPIVEAPATPLFRKALGDESAAKFVEPAIVPGNEKVNDEYERRAPMSSRRVATGTPATWEPCPSSS